MPHDVFISYSSNDQQAAMAVLHGIEAAGIRCWMAPRDIPPGAIWAKAIMDGIAGSRILVVVFSTSANRSSHVLTEVDAAVRKGAVIVPFRIENVMPDGALEYHLRTRHWLDALTPDMEEHVERLAEQLRAILATDRGPEPATQPPRPIPAGLPKFRRHIPKRWRFTKRLIPVIAGGVLLLTMGGWWLSRPHAIDQATFTVHEVSPGGGNETTLRVVAHGLRFFEGPNDNAALAQREYQTAFRRGLTRYIKTEIALSYDPPGRVVRFPFACILQREGAQVITTLALTATVQATWHESYHTAGWGNPAPGSWQPGRYRVECRYGNELVARDWFSVEDGGLAMPPDAPVATAQPFAEVHARIKAIRLFESGLGKVERNDRIYAHTFTAATTRYINPEVTLGFDRTSRPISGKLTCRFLRDRSEEIGRVSLGFDIAVGETEHWASSGWGNQNPASWRPGDYLVACEDGATTLGQTGFTVE